MGKTAALGLKLLWTMGCPPTKVNTQTTHSCPSLKHADTLTTRIQLKLTKFSPYPPSGIFIFQDYTFTEINISSFLPGINFFFSLSFVLLLPFCIPQIHPTHTFLLTMWQIQSHEDILKSKSEGFLHEEQSLFVTACYRRVPGSWSQNWCWGI